jgi:hypothetical protein
MAQEIGYFMEQTKVRMLDDRAAMPFIYRFYFGCHSAVFARVHQNLTQLGSKIFKKSELVVKLRVD